jgi:hypothetical protein
VKFVWYLLRKEDQRAVILLRKRISKVFSWPDFLNARGIDYRDSGPNTSVGNVVVKCPFCGVGDEGEHMSIAINGLGWRCFRRPMEHRGRSPVRLIAALLKCSSADAARIAGVRDLPVSLLGSVRARLVKQSVTIDHGQQSLNWSPDFKPFSDKITARPYLFYLSKRLDLSLTKTITLTQSWDLRWASSGPYAGRVIFPVRQEGQLMTWTGRAIGNSQIRYKTLSTDLTKAKTEGLPAALAPTSNLLLFHDDILKQPARTLVITEGPFDAAKVRVLGHDFQMQATCLFGLNLSDAQVVLLAAVVPRYGSAFLLLDRGALAPAMRMRARLMQLGVGLRHLPLGVKDPGSLSKKDIAFVQGLC